MNQPQITTDANRAERLRAALPKIELRSQGFAQSLLSGFERFGCFTDRQRPYVLRLVADAEAPAAARERETARRNVGDLSGIMALFAKAQQHLKRPAVELGVPGYGPEQAVRINVAGERAKVPGSLTLTSAERYDTGKEFPERKWFGRILPDGTFEPSRDLTAVGPAYLDAVRARLAAFAADPSKVGGEDGQLHGRCCFCRLPLSDERSTAAGYGRQCASNFGLAWGERPAEFGEGV